MHGQRNHTNQVGRDFYAPRPTFQQHPPAATLPTPPPPSHRGPFTPQLQVFQQGRPYFHPTSGISSFQNSLPSVPRQGASAPVVSSGRSSAQSYVSHTQNPQVHVSNQTYQTPEQHLPWSQNVYPSPYPLPSPQGHIQYPSDAPPPPFPPYSSSSSFLISDPCGSSTHAIRQHWPLPPPPPRPPPLPTYSPPRVPPLPPSSPQSDVLSTNDGSRSLKDLVEGDNLIVEHPPQAKPAEDRNVHQNEIPCHGHTENNGPKLKSIDAVVDHSSGVSDMEMEDDITHDVEEKNGRLSTNSNGGCTSISQEDYVKDQLQDLQHSGEHRVSIEALHENLLVAEASILKDLTGGMTKNRRIELPLDASVNGSSSQHKFTSQPSVPVACEETGLGKLSGQLMEGANPFNLLQGYASGDLSENDCENLLGDVNSPALLNVRSSTSDDQKVCNFRSKVRVKDLLESNKHMPPKSMVESPRNVTEADELSSATGICEKLYDKSCRGQESITTSAAVQSRISSRNCDAYIEVANDYKQDMKGNLTEMKVDEFGRLVREGPSDSDTSDSPHYTRRRAKRARKRSSSQSRSRSPHDRRRRPGRRNGRRGRSRSLSPKRRRSRSWSPVLKRNTEFSGDKQKREKSQLTECFDFIRGKCYRGSSCLYLHHETDKSDRLRYSRGKQQSTLRSPDVGESKVLYDKEIKDKGLPQDMLKLRKVRDSKELTVDLCTHPVADVEKNHLSVYSVHGMNSGNGNALMLESPAQYSDEMPEIADQQGKRVGDSLVSESSSLVQASAHLSADKPDEKLGPTCQLLPVESPISKKPFPIEEVESQSLKQLPTSVANHPSEFNFPLPPVSQLTSAPSGQDYNLMPPSARFHSTLENHTPYQTPVSYQHSHIPEQSNSLANSFLPPPPPPSFRPPPPPPPHHLSISVKHGEHGNHSQQSLQPAWDGLPSYTSIRAQPNELSNRLQSFQYQIYPLPQEPDQILIPTENLASSSFPVSNLPSLQSGHIIGEHAPGHAVQGMDPLQSISQSQYHSLGGGFPPDSNSLQGHPYFQQTSYGLQYSGGGGVPEQFSQPEKVNSSMSTRTTPDFLERNQPSYALSFAQSRIANHFNPYSSTFDRPLSSKFKLNASTQENGTTISTKHGAHGSSSVPVDVHNDSSVDQAQSVLPRLGGDQYDPLFDSIELDSTSFSRAEHKKLENPGDSDNLPRLGGSGKVVDEEIIKHEGGISIDSLSANDSIEHEEFGETADAEVGGVLSESLSTPNDPTNKDAGEIEIDQVKDSRKKRKGKDSKSTKLFKISIASFVKNVLKPSWRQGNMSKEAFKTIVKKTVDKVSGAMKGHRIPKSQEKITHYIDSSRGKLTKLVMGYVDKYVNA